MNGTVQPDATKIAWVGAMLLAGSIGSALTISASAVVVFALTTVLTLLFGHSLGMHRLFIHRSYECPRAMEYLLVHLGVLVGLAGPLGMLWTHDTRDWAQRQPECHPYFSHARVWYVDLWWQLCCSISLRRPPAVVVEPEIMSDRVYRAMERTWMWQQLPLASVLFIAGGWSWVFWGVATRVSVSMLGHWLIGYFAHNPRANPRRQQWHVEGAGVQGLTVPWVSLLTMGESWHNNHHAFPRSANLGLGDGQWDPGWWTLKALRRIGLVWNIRACGAGGASQPLTKPLSPVRP